MMPADRPPKPHPDCTWDEVEGLWIWPDQRTPEEKAADEEIARQAEAEPWDLEEFLERHSSDVPKP